MRCGRCGFGGRRSGEVFVVMVVRMRGMRMVSLVMEI